MVFSSITFMFLFLPLVFALHFMTPQKMRNLLLVIASLIFYAWGETGYVLIMIVSILLSYGFGIAIDSTRNTPLSRYLLTTGIVLNVGMLAIFKYANFFLANINDLLHCFHRSPVQFEKIHLPIGISFFTFHALSYLIDVYRGNVSVQKNFLNVALYITLFPQLVAGPIIRYYNVAQQIIARSISWDDFAYGTERFIFGMGKKVLIANPMAGVADRIFQLKEPDLTSPLAWLGLICYTFQLYFDFSGYSDMAIGLGRTFGFHFQENFNYPYISQSMQEMWRRWHISLSTWFRDYVYYPMGGSLKGPIRTYVNTVFVFFLIGFWHGASWNFISWGIYQGLFLVIERMGLIGVLKGLWRPLRHAYALFVFIVGLIAIRTETYSDMITYGRALFGMAAQQVYNRYTVAMFLDRQILLLLVLAAIFSTPVWVVIQRRFQAQENLPVEMGMQWLDGLFNLSKSFMLLAVLAFSAMSLSVGAYNPFIYFKF